MCHAIPALIVDVLDDDQVRVELGGVRKVISSVLVGPCSVGDYVIVHVGFALGRMDADEAKATIDTLKALDDPALTLEDAP